MPLETTETLLEPTADQIDGLLAASARHSDLRAVCDFGKLVFGVDFADHHKQWIKEILTNKRVVLVAPRKAPRPR